MYLSHTHTLPLGEGGVFLFPSSNLTVVLMNRQENDSGLDHFTMNSSTGISPGCKLRAVKISRGETPALSPRYDREGTPTRTATGGRSFSTGVTEWACPDAATSDESEDGRDRRSATPPESRHVDPDRRRNGKELTLLLLRLVGCDACIRTR